MHRVVKSIDLDFAHHIKGHRGACFNIHGHTWRFEVCLEADELDPMGMVVDFSDITAHLLTPLLRLLDHSLVLPEDEVAHLQDAFYSIGRVFGQMAPNEEDAFDVVFAWPQPESQAKPCMASRREYNGLSVTVLPCVLTSEGIAEWFYRVCCREVHPAIRVAWVRVYECLHPTMSFAEYTSS